MVFLLRFAGHGSELTVTFGGLKSTQARNAGYSSIAAGPWSQNTKRTHESLENLAFLSSESGISAETLGYHTEQRYLVKHSLLPRLSRITDFDSAGVCRLFLALILLSRGLYHVLWPWSR